MDTSRLHLNVSQCGQLVAIEVFVDGEDLTPEQERIAAAFVTENPDIEKVIGVLPSRGG